jgi:diacylglycerol kinase family enzyme
MRGSMTDAIEAPAEPPTAPRGAPLLVLNPTASRLADPAARGRVRDAAIHAIRARTGRIPDVVEGTHAESRAALATATDRELVVVAGGDGSIREAVGALAHSGVALGIVPGGTGNVFAASLRVGSIKVATEAIRHGPPRSIDLGRARWSSTDGPTEGHFIVAAGTGFDAQVMAAAEHEWKRRLRFGAYIGAGVRELTRLRPALFRIVADDIEVELEGLVVLVANAGEIVPGRIGPRQPIDPTDGLLDLIVVGGRDLLAGLRGAAALLLRSGEQSGTVIRRGIRTVRIESDPAQPVLTDGDAPRAGIREAVVIPAALRVLGPPIKRGQGGRA